MLLGVIAAPVGKPLIVRPAYRSPEHNRAVGGATRSKHLDGAAFDIAMANHDPVVFEAAAREVGFLGFGFYPRSGFMHVDLGPARQWGERFPVRATAFAAETPPAREVLAQSRTMKGGGAAGVATLGAAGVEVAQSVLAEPLMRVNQLIARQKRRFKRTTNSDHAGPVAPNLVAQDFTADGPDRKWGGQTSPTFGRQRAGSTSLSCWTSSRGAPLAGPRAIA